MPVENYKSGAVSPGGKVRKPYTPKSVEQAACAACGAMFIKTLGHKKYCSTACQIKHGNKVKLLKSIDRSERPCAECGVIFTPEYGVKNKRFCSQDCRQAHRSAHKQKVLASRMDEDPLLKFVRRVRTFICQSMGRSGFTKRSRAFEILGCDWEFFKSHIEKQFVGGMSWDRRSEWHLDHIIPVSSAQSEAEARALNHFSNLRPLWAKDNMRKGTK